MNIRLGSALSRPKKGAVSGPSGIPAYCGDTIALLLSLGRFDLAELGLVVCHGL